MIMMLDTAFNSKRNSLDFLRFALAVAVIVVHGYWLGGYGPDPLWIFSHGQMNLGPLAVAGFFVLSGFLITRSRQQSTSFFRYLWHRCLRILPGFWACLLVTALVFGPCIYWLTYGKLSGYFQVSPFGPLDYLKENVLLRIRQDRIGDLLAGGKFPFLINGSLWTLYDEFKCYLIIGVLGMLGLTDKHRWVIAALTMLLVGIYVFEYCTHNLLRASLPFFIEAFFLEHLTYFFIGSTAYLFADQAPMRRGLFIACVALWLGTGYVNFYPVVALITYPYILLWLAVRLPITRWAKYGDFSYGMYLYAFPIQRILALLGVNALGVWIYIAAALVATTLFAILSYRLVESKFRNLRGLTVGDRKAASQLPPKTEPGDMFKSSQ
jgi:peptidoglycan/LPS O-acetylase OafA/YrhL